MIAKFYKNNSDDRCLRKDLTEIVVSSGQGVIPESNLIPRLTGADATVTASSENPTYPAWAAFNTTINNNWANPIPNSCWLPTVNEPAPWIQFEVPDGKYATKINIICFSNYSAAFTCGITITGSNDGLTFDTLYTGSITGDLQAATNVSYDLVGEEYYKYIRLSFDAPLSVAYQPSLFIMSINADGYHIGTVESYELPIEFKQDESRLNPSLILQHSANIEGANYCSIGDRYYYITDITYSQQRIILTLHEDVLMSHASDILKLGVIVDRQTNEGNPYLKDMEMPVEAKRNVQVKIFPYGFSGDTYILATNGA